MLNRSDKKGYPIPSQDWLNNSSHEITLLFNKDSFIANYLDINSIKKGNLSSQELWRMIFLELWFKEFFVKDPITGAYSKSARLKV